MKKLFFTTLLSLLFSNSFAGTLIHESSLDSYEINAECADLSCDEYEINMIITSKTRQTLEKTVLVKNDKSFIEDTRRSICKDNLKNVARETGFAMIGVGPLMAAYSRAYSKTKSPVLRAVEQACVFSAGVTFNIVAFPYFAARGAIDLREALANNKDFSEALNLLLFTDETLQIDSETNHLVVNSFIYGLEK